ncbi:hypothetical protein WICMUC_004189 [Wickerhamomyces mucosus]|uniref:beta-glucosidase n=1 Tax=Wickerhamomyces mucosus TaxID=1378264 RepID=A0A9P8PII2_9ASCO|nr:hypothetical protein WICMUC_004189 [Wickerhamomyces mucosus]
MAAFEIEDVLQKLTIEEKVNLLAGIDFWHTYAVERLNIPSIRVSDGPNGIRGTKFFNAVPGAILPNGTGLASTFDKDLLLEAGKFLGVEAKHKSAHVDLGPTTNIQRGPNGGRGFESFSEDPYLSGIVSAQIINGLQSEHVGATIKHFVANDLEHQRNSSDSILTQRALREIYLEPFRLAIKHSNPVALMTSYNKVNGIHASQSKQLLKDILKDEWKYEGTTISDWYGTYTNKESIQNGLDLEMPGPARLRTVQSVAHQVSTKEIHINDLDDRVRGVLKLVKYASESGIPYNGPEDTENNTPETRAFLRKLAGDSIVLLKNEDNILPLKKEDKIAVIGPNAKYSAKTGGGSASLTPYYITTPYGGISEKLGSNPPYTIGAHAHDLLPGLAEQLINPVTGKQGIHASFYYTDSSDKSREKFNDLDLNTSFHILFDYERERFEGIPFWIDFEGIFIPEESAEYEFGLTVAGTAQLFVNDKLVVDNKTKQTLGTAFFSTGTIEEKGKIFLQKGEKYNIKVEFGSGPTYSLKAEGPDFKGNGAIAFGGSKVIDKPKEIERAVEIAQSVDKVVLVIGTNGDWESEGYDRKDITLPGNTNDLVEAILKVNSNVIVVNQSGTPVEFPWVSKPKAILQAWFGGNELGNAIADVLYGDVNPNGKLSLSFPIKFEDNPAYLNFKTERGRVLYGEDIFVGYRFYEKLQRKVLFPFGYGLSYTKFKFDNLKISIDELQNQISLNVEITNIGSFKGKEVVQFYFSKIDSDIIRPIKELKGFNKVELDVNESKIVDINLDLKDSLSFFDEYQEKWSLQSGDYEVSVGSSSDDIELREIFNIKEGKFWLGL